MSMFAYNRNTDKKQGLKPGAYLITDNYKELDACFISFGI